MEELVHTPAGLGTCQETLGPGRGESQRLQRAEPSTGGGFCDPRPQADSASARDPKWSGQQGSEKQATLPPCPLGGMPQSSPPGGWGPSSTCCSLPSPLPPSPLAPSALTFRAALLWSSTSGKIKGATLRDLTVSASATQRNSRLCSCQPFGSSDVVGREELVFPHQHPLPGSRTASETGHCSHALS